MIPKKLISSLRDLVHELVIGNFAKLETDGRIGRLNATDLEHVLKRYGRTFIELPDEAFQVDEAYPLKGSKGQSWAVDLPLWTAKEG